MREKREVVIVGAGPAGITTAIQLKRYGVEPVLLEKDEVGGLLRNANLVENYPGFPEGIGGLELIERFKQHLKNVGVNVSFEEVLELVDTDGAFLVKTDQRELISDFAVVASGTRSRKLADASISDEIEERMVYGVHPIRDVRGKDIVIIGAGDAAFDYALSLSRRNTVTILSRGEEARCIGLLWKRAMASDNVSFRANVDVTGVSREADKISVELTSNETGESARVAGDYVVVAIGRDPSFDFVESELGKRTEAPGASKRLHMIGDVKNGMKRQVAISVGDGLTAAMEIREQMLKEQR